MRGTLSDDDSNGRRSSPGRELEEWAASGAMSLTGRPGESPIGPPAGLIRKLHRIANDIARISERMGRAVAIDPVALLGERAAIAGLARRGDVSCGGAARLVRAVDNWIAVSLARPDDVDLVPAWLECACGDDPWKVIRDTAAARTAADLVSRGRMLGLPVAALPTGRAGRASPGFVRPGRAIALEGPIPLAKRLQDMVVADLSALWAGPLCGAVLAEAGANVVKVESTTRPDGARQGPSPFFDLLNGTKRSVALDFTSDDGRRTLRGLLARVDVVIEASRPRALEQLGIDARAIVAGGGPRVWVSLTGHGRYGQEREWVALGDDAAAAGGLVVRDGAGPCFCADAIADPSTGLVAASAVLDALARGGRWLIDVSLAAVAGALAGPTIAAGSSTRFDLPRARSAARAAPALGADTAAVLADLGQTA